MHSQALAHLYTVNESIARAAGAAQRHRLYQELRGAVRLAEEAGWITAQEGAAVRQAADMALAGTRPVRPAVLERYATVPDAQDVAGVSTQLALAQEELEHRLLAIDLADDDLLAKINRHLPAERRWRNLAHLKQGWGFEVIGGAKLLRAMGMFCGHDVERWEKRVAAATGRSREWEGDDM